MPKPISKFYCEFNNEFDSLLEGKTAKNALKKAGYSNVKWVGAEDESVFYQSSKDGEIFEIEVTER